MTEVANEEVNEEVEGPIEAKPEVPAPISVPPSETPPAVPEPTPEPEPTPPAPGLLPVQVSATMLVRFGGRVLLSRRSLETPFWRPPAALVTPPQIPLQVAVKAAEDESGIRPSDPVEVAVLHMLYADGTRRRLHVFLAETFQGEVRPDGEGRESRWEPIERLPLREELGLDPRELEWLPRALAGAFVIGRYVFDCRGDLARYEIIEPDRAPGYDAQELV